MAAPPRARRSPRALRAIAMLALLAATSACAAVLGIDGDYYEVSASPPPLAPPASSESGVEDAGEAGEDALAD